MKFSCQKEDIVQAIQIVMKAVSPKPQTPILSGIYMKAEGNQLTLQATDYEMGIICNIEAQVAAPGEMVLAGRYAQEVIRRLPGTTVDFEYNNQEKMVYITSNRSKFSFLSMEATDYPTIARVEGRSSFQMSHPEYSFFLLPRGKPPYLYRLSPGAEGGFHPDGSYRYPQAGSKIRYPGGIPGRAEADHSFQALKRAAENPPVRYAEDGEHQLQPDTDQL